LKFTSEDSDALELLVRPPGGGNKGTLIPKLARFSGLSEETDSRASNITSASDDQNFTLVVNDQV